MDKISEEKLQQLPGAMKIAAATIRDLAAAVQHESNKVAELTHELEAMKLARAYEARGVDPSVPFEAKVASFRSLSPADLQIREEALKLHSGPGALPKLASDEYRSTGTQVTNLDSYIISGAAYEGR